MPAPSPPPDFFDQLAALPTTAMFDPQACLQSFSALAHHTLRPQSFFEAEHAEHQKAVIGTGIRLQSAFAILAAQTRQSAPGIAREHQSRAGIVLCDLSSVAQGPRERMCLIQQGSKALPKIAAVDMEIATTLADTLCRSAGLNPSARPVRTRELIMQPFSPSPINPLHNVTDTVIFGNTPATSYAQIHIHGFRQVTGFSDHRLFRAPLTEIEKIIMDSAARHTLRIPRERHLHAQSFIANALRLADRQATLPTLLEIAARASRHSRQKLCRS